MAANILNIGVSGLNTAQINLATTGQNISNASTPGYTRQTAMQQANDPMFTGSGFIGQGANVETVKRVYDQYLTTQLLGAQTNVSALESYSGQISQIDNLVADTSSGLSSAMNNFFTGLGELVSNPSSIPSRQAFLSEAKSMASRLNAMDTRINEVRLGVNSRISDQVVQINTQARQIADINQRIIIAQSAGSMQPANDLLDQRDQLINELNKTIRATAVPQSDGSYSIFIGNGQLLVTGNTPSELVAVQDIHDPLRTVVGMQQPSGQPLLLPEAQLTGGTMGGLLAFRNETLDMVQNTLGRIAVTMGQNFNDQHRLGQDLTGTLGGDFFTLPTPQVLDSSDNPQPPIKIDVKITKTADLKSSDYLLTSNGGGNYSLLRLSDNTMLVRGGALPTPPATVDGLTIVPAAVPPTGASYLIQAVRNVAGNIGVLVTDPRTIAAATPIRTGISLSNHGTGAISPGTVSNVQQIPPGAAITLRYLNTPVPSLDGFPVGSTVDNGAGQFIKITSPTTAVPYTIGNNISFNGISLALTGAPVHGDSFEINAARGMALGNAAPAYPLTITTGVNDQFDLVLDGGPVNRITVAAGVYNSGTALASAVKTAIGPGATVTVNPAGQLLVTSAMVGGTTAATLAAAGVNTGFAAMFGGGITNPPMGTTPGVTNTGLTDMFGVPGAASFRGAAQGTAAPSVYPLTIVAAVNDQFDISLNGGPATTIILPPATYMSGIALASAIQTAIGGGATVKVDDVSGKMIVTSNMVGGASAVNIAVTGVNQGFNTMFGGAVTVGNRAVQSGGLLLLDPTDIKAGVNDRFSINVDGAGVQTILVPEGRYTPNTLAYQIQSTVNSQFAAPGVEVKINGAGQLSITSNRIGGPSGVALGNVVSGLSTMSVNTPVTRTESLPVAPVTISYRESDNSFTGFPVGAMVTVEGDTQSPYQITSTLIPVKYTPGAQVSFNGYSFALSGVPKQGDKFTVGPNDSGVSDNRNALLLAQFQTAKTLDGGKATYQGVYASMVNQVGNKAREVQVGSQAQQSLADQAQKSRDSVSAVNLDEEAANLLRYQQAYQASAKVIAVAGKLFDNLLQVM